MSKSKIKKYLEEQIEKLKEISKKKLESVDISEYPHCKNKTLIVRVNYQ